MDRTPIKLGHGSYIHEDEYENFFGVEVTVGAYSSIARGLVILGGQHPPALYPQAVSNYPFKEAWGVDYWPCGRRGSIHIGSDVWVGTNVTILDGVTIGHGAIVGAGSVISKDVQPYAVVVGSQRLAKYRFDEKTIKKLLDIAWWDWPEEKIRDNILLMKEVEAFVRAFGT